MRPFFILVNRTVQYNISAEFIKICFNVIGFQYFFLDFPFTRMACLEILPNGRFEIWTLDFHSFFQI